MVFGSSALPTTLPPSSSSFLNGLEPVAGPSLTSLPRPLYPPQVLFREIKNAALIVADPRSNILTLELISVLHKPILLLQLLHEVRVEQLRAGVILDVLFLGTSFFLVVSFLQLFTAANQMSQGHLGVVLGQAHCFLLLLVGELGGELTDLLYRVVEHQVVLVVFVVLPVGHRVSITIQQQAQHTDRRSEVIALEHELHLGYIVASLDPEVPDFLIFEQHIECLHSIPGIQLQVHEAPSLINQILFELAPDNLPFKQLAHIPGELLPLLLEVVVNTEVASHLTIHDFVIVAEAMQLALVFGQDLLDLQHFLPGRTVYQDGVYQDFVSVVTLMEDPEDPLIQAVTVPHVDVGHYVEETVLEGGRLFIVRRILGEVVLCGGLTRLDIFGGSCRRSNLFWLLLVPKKVGVIFRPNIFQFNLRAPQQLQIIMQQILNFLGILFLFELYQQQFQILIIVDFTLHRLFSEASFDFVNELLTQSSMAKPRKTHIFEDKRRLQRRRVTAFVGLLLFVRRFGLAVDLLKKCQRVEFFYSSRTHPLVGIPNLKLLKVSLVGPHEPNPFGKGIDSISLALFHDNLDDVLAREFFTIHNWQEARTDFLHIGEVDRRLHPFNKSLHEELKLVLLFEAQVVPLHPTFIVINTDEDAAALGIQKSVYGFQEGVFVL